MNIARLVIGPTDDINRAFIDEYKRILKKPEDFFVELSNLSYRLDGVSNLEIEIAKKSHIIYSTMNINSKLHTSICMLKDGKYEVNANVLFADYTLMKSMVGYKQTSIIMSLPEIFKACNTVKVFCWNKHSEKFYGILQKINRNQYHINDGAEKHCNGALITQISQILDDKHFIQI